MSSELADILAEEAAMYKEDLKRLGNSDKDKLMRERLTTVLATMRTFTAVRKKRDSLLHRAQEDATRLGNELHALKRKNPDSEHEPEPQPKRARPLRACSAALSHKDRLKIAKDKHDRAVERVRQIECEYAEPMAQATVAVLRARQSIRDMSPSRFVSSESSIGHPPSPPTSGPNSDDAPVQEVVPPSIGASNNESLRGFVARGSSIELPSSPGTTLLGNDDAPAEEFMLPSADASEDESLPPLTGPNMGIEVDMTRKLSQSLQGRKLRLILDRFKKTFSTTWNDGEQDIDAVVKLALPGDADRMSSARNEIVVYQHLHSLQGTCIPRLLDFGRTKLDGKRYFAVVLERIEDRECRSSKVLDLRASITELSDQERAACRDAIKQMHDLGVIHWDIRGSNLMFRDNLPGPNRIPVFIGLGNAAIVEDINDEDEDEDYACLEQMFEENDAPF